MDGLVGVGNLPEHSAFASDFFFVIDVKRIEFLLSMAVYENQNFGFQDHVFVCVQKYGPKYRFF